jgi:serine/threonine protein phosphatase PrpC
MYLSTEQLTTSRPYTNTFSYSVETLLEKGSGRMNEDVLLQDRNLFGVFDGATSLSNSPPTKDYTGGLLAAQIAASAFQHGGDDLCRSVENANRRIRDAILKADIPLGKRHHYWSTSAAVVHIGKSSFNYCQTGDSLILVLHKDGSYRMITPEIDHDRETLQMWKQSKLPIEANIHDTLYAQILAVRLQMNVSYGVLNGEPEAMEFINHGRETLDSISAILLFTDGLFIPREYPQQKSDWGTFAQLYHQGGLKTIRDHVRRLQNQDPTCRQYPRFKTHDDIAAIAIRLDT